MIISFKHRFIFLKTRKTAGTSIEIALSGICGADDVITPISKGDELTRKKLTGRSAMNYTIPFKHHTWKERLAYIFHNNQQMYYNHMPASELLKRIPPPIWKEYFVFCFDRNPWDKVIAHYFHINRNDRYKSFSDYLQSKRWEVLHGYKMHVIGNKSVADKVYKYEEVERSLDELSERLKLKKPLSISEICAKTGFRQDRRPYKEFLTESEASFIEKNFKEDIEFMGYSF